MIEHQPVEVAVAIDHLQRHRLVAPIDVVSAVHDAERAAAEFRVDDVVADLIRGDGNGHDLLRGHHVAEGRFKDNPRNAGQQHFRPGES